MSAERLNMHRLQELIRLHRLGLGAREVARVLKMSPKTELRYRAALDGAGFLRGNPTDIVELSILKDCLLRSLPQAVPCQSTSCVEAWRSVVGALLDQGAGPKAIHDHLRLIDHDFPGSLSAVKRLCRRIVGERGPDPDRVPIPVETAPGEVAQVDFGYAGKLYDPDRGVMRRAWIFAIVLAYSRHVWADIVFDQRTETWIALHVRAFSEFGGVPGTTIPDNLKSAVVRGAFGHGDSPELNRSYIELARHYGFKVDPTPPRSPKKKGKVESSVKYIKRNFLRTLESTDVREARALLRRWLVEIAGQRLHGTTARRPIEMFEAEERHLLRPLPATIFEPVTWKKAGVHPDWHIAFDGRLYSVPWQLIGKDVSVRATPTTLAIYHDDVRIATHSRTGSGYRSTLDEHAPQGRVAWRHRSREYWQERADRLGTEVGALVREIFDAEDVLSQLRTVQSIVTHLEKFPTTRARAASARALRYGSHSYPAIKNILARGLDLLPEPEDEIQWQTTLPAPRFARSAHSFSLLAKEVLHECNR
ncbi:MAG: IS21 family transposase [Planctomycetes bacterium]|nr:IS21 family transposase [Planctomycetota bacterium]